MTTTRRCPRSIRPGCWRAPRSNARSRAARRRRLSAGGARLQSRVFCSYQTDRATGVARPQLSPDLARDLDAARKLGPLLFFRQQIAFFGAGEAALRREA